jgi:hypothetical protein
MNYFRLADRHHNFVDNKRPEFLDKGNYQEPSLILTSLLRGEAAMVDAIHVINFLVGQAFQVVPSAFEEG